MSGRHDSSLCTLWNISYFGDTSIIVHLPVEGDTTETTHEIQVVSKSLGGKERYTD